MHLLLASRNEIPKPFDPTPEKLLMIEVMHDAINQRDINWFKSEKNDHFFSFINCCHMLNLPYQTVRKNMLNLFSSTDKPKLKLKINHISNKVYTHPYVKQNHCRECRQRYWNNYMKERYPNGRPSHLR